MDRPGKSVLANSGPFKAVEQRFLLIPPFGIDKVGSVPHGLRHGPGLKEGSVSDALEISARGFWQSWLWIGMDAGLHHRSNEALVMRLRTLITTWLWPVLLVAVLAQWWLSNAGWTARVWHLTRDGDVVFEDGSFGWDFAGYSSRRFPGNSAFYGWGIFFEAYRAATPAGGFFRSDKLYVSFWWPASVLGVVNLCVAARAWRRKALWSGGSCRKCGYDLRATPDRCPECGTAAIAPKPPRQRAGAAGIVCFVRQRLGRGPGR